VTRNLAILIFDATIAVFLGSGLYASFRSGVIKTIRGQRRAFRRADEPIRYWLVMSAVAFAFVVCTAFTLLLGFAVAHQLISGP
jgi:hypothetical protein